MNNPPDVATAKRKFRSKIKKHVAGFLRPKVAGFIMRFCPNNNYLSRLHDRLLLAEEA